MPAYYPVVDRSSRPSWSTFLQVEWIDSMRLLNSNVVIYLDWLMCCTDVLWTVSCFLLSVKEWQTYRGLSATYVSTAIQSFSISFTKINWMQSLYSNKRHSCRVKWKCEFKHAYITLSFLTHNNSLSLGQYTNQLKWVKSIENLPSRSSKHDQPVVEFFLSRGSCFSVSSSTLSGCRKNHWQ